MGLVMLQGTEYALSREEVFSGLTFSLGGKTPRLAAYAVISLMGVLNVAGFEILLYPYGVLEKGYGRHVGPSDSVGWPPERAG